MSLSVVEAQKDFSHGHEHVVKFYDEGAFPARSVAEFLLKSLSQGGVAIAVATKEHLELIETHLSRRGMDVPFLKGRGQILFLDANETLSAFLRGGEPDPKLFDSVVGGVVRGAALNGSHIAAFGEMVALLVAQGNCQAAIRLEELWNPLIQAHGISLLCAYPLQSFADPAALAEFTKICAEHSQVLPADSYSLEGSPADQLRSIAILQQKACALESEILERKLVEEALQEQSRTNRILQEVASGLVAEQDLEKVVQLVTDAGRELSGAQFGAFFYNVTNSEGESYTLYTLSGVPREAFSSFPMPRNTEIFGPTFRGEGVVRLGDVTKDPRFGLNAPYFGMPAGHLPVRSYLAAPVISKGGEVLGGLFFGNSEADVFSGSAENLVMALAAQAAVAIDNVNLQGALQRELSAVRMAERESRHLAAIVQSSDDAIISKTLKGIITSWNPGAQQIFGYTAEEAIGQPVTMLFPPDHINEEIEIIRRIKSGRKVEHYETKRRHKEGHLLDISLTISPIRDRSGEIVGASKIARDITDKKRAEEALQQATSELETAKRELETRVEQRTASLKEAVAQMEEFSYTVSHDLRAPLRAMNVHCGMLKEDFGEMLREEPQALESVNRIADSCVRLDKMIRDILTYGRVARDELVLEPVDLNRVVGEIISNYPALQPPAAKISVEKLDTVIGHEPSLVQMVSNLLINATKFVEEGVTPVVRVHTAKEGGMVCLSVEDNGIGIAPEFQHRLFTMFERIHPELPYEGTGIGLAIVRKAADRMGGRVGLESDGQSGSRFWVELKAAD